MELLFLALLLSEDPMANDSHMAPAPVSLGVGAPSSALSRHYYFVNESKTWAEAQAYCRRNYTDLATVDNMWEMVQLKAAIDPTYSGALWIGLYRGSPRRWGWSSGENSQYVNWSSSEPNGGDRDGLCGAVNVSSGWIDAYCTDYLESVCYSATTKQFVHVKKLDTWWNAQAYCRQSYTHLATIHNKQEEQLLTDLLSVQYAWIGLFYDNWKWSDRRSSTFRHWRSGQPINSTNCASVMTTWNGQWNDQLCTVKLPFMCYKAQRKRIVKLMVTSSGENDLNSPVMKSAILSMDEFQRTYVGLEGVAGIVDDVLVSGKTSEEQDRNLRDMLRQTKERHLKLNLASVREVITSDTNSQLMGTRHPKGVGAPSSALSRHYYFVNESKTWSEAQAYCRENYTDLATVDNMEEMVQLKAAIDPNYSGSLWIGLYKGSPRSWGWSSGEISQYVNWRRGEPNGGNRDGLCAAKDAYTGWVDNECTMLSEFVCYSGKLHHLPSRKLKCLNYSDQTLGVKESDGLGKEAAAYSGCVGPDTSVPFSRWRVKTCGVNVRDGGKRDTSDLLSCPHYPLQGLAIRCGAVPKPGSAAAAQDALDGSSVEGGEDGRWEMCLPQLSQEVETLLGFLGYGAGVEGPDTTKQFVHVRKKDTWRNAQAYCRKYYTDLATVHNEQEHQYLSDLLGGSYYVWVGFFYDIWKWSDRRSSMFRYWMDGQPYSNTNCVTVVTAWNGQWDDTSCTAKLPFMCYKARRQRIVKLMVTSSGENDLNDPAMKSAILSLYTLYPVHPISSTPHLQYTPYPVHPISSTPHIQYTPYPVHPISSTPYIQYTPSPVHPISGTSHLRYIPSPVHPISGTPHLRYTPSPVHPISGTPHLQYTPSPVHPISSTPYIQYTPYPVHPISSKSHLQYTLYPVNPISSKSHLQYTPSPVHPISSTPHLQYTPSPVHPISSTPHLQYTPSPVHPISSTPHLQYTPSPVHPISSTPHLQYTPSPVHPISSTPHLQYTPYPVHPISSKSYISPYTSHLQYTTTISKYTPILHMGRTGQCPVARGRWARYPVAWGGQARYPAARCGRARYPVAHGGQARVGRRARYPVAWGGRARYAVAWWRTGQCPVAWGGRARYPVGWGGRASLGGPSSALSRYYYFVNERKTWPEAQAYCRENYTDLATVENMEEMVRLKAAIDPTYNGALWIGLQRSSPRRWGWSSGEVVQYINWTAGEPNGMDNDGLCTAKRAYSGWVDSNCTDLLEFVCSMETNSTKQFIHVRNPVTWRKAQAYCRANYTDLATVHNVQEQEQLTDLLGSVQHAWIGLFFDNWKWSDQRSSTFRYWREGEPSDPKGFDNCVAVLTEWDGYWNDAHCDGQTAFMCYKGQSNTHTVYASRHRLVQLVLTNNGSSDLNDPAMKKAILSQIIQIIYSEKVNSEIEVRPVPSTPPSPVHPVSSTPPSPVRPVPSTPRLHYAPSSVRPVSITPHLQYIPSPVHPISSSPHLQFTPSPVHPISSTPHIQYIPSPVHPISSTPHLQHTPYPVHPISSTFHLQFTPSPVHPISSTFHLQFTPYPVHPISSTSHLQYIPSPVHPISSTSHIQYTPSPVHPISSTSHLQYIPSPVHPISSTPHIQYIPSPVHSISSSPHIQYTPSPVHPISSTPHLQYIPSPVHPISSTPHLQYTPSPVHPISSTSHLQYTPSPVHPISSTSHIQYIPYPVHPISSLGGPSSALSRYYYFVNERKTWPEAQAYCRENYTDLATVENMEEMVRLKAAIDPTYNGALWIGLQRRSPRRWGWSSGEVVQYINWTAGEPNGLDNDGLCTAKRAYKAFADAFCTDLLEFVCYMETNSTKQFIHVRNPVTWRKAQAYCRANYTDLATVHNVQEQEQLTDLLGSVQHVWIGLFFDNWKWSDQRSSTFRYWREGEPTGKGDCVAVLTEWNGQWNNTLCDPEIPFMCYKGLGGPSSALSRHYYFVNESKTWSEAQSTTRTWPPFTTSRNISHHQYFLVITYTWIGLFYDNWKWSDRRTSTFRYWMVGQPWSITGKANCAAMVTSWNGQWDDSECNEKTPFMCYKALRQRIVKLTVTSSGKKDLNDPAVKKTIMSQVEKHWRAQQGTTDSTLKWREKNGEVFHLCKKRTTEDHQCGLGGPSSALSRHYYFVNESKTWSEAQRYCRENYTDLATVDNKEEMVQLKAAVDPTYSGAMWIGLYRGSQRSWGWSSGETVQYVNWKSGEPNGGDKDGLCAAIKLSDGWVDVLCTDSLEFICYSGELQYSSSMELSVLEKASNWRKLGLYVSINGGPGRVSTSKCNALVCKPTKQFIPIKKTDTWRNAQAYCRKHYTDLATVHNEQEHQTISGLLSKPYTWIGLFYDNWKWSDRRSSTFRYWMVGQPWSVTANTNCAAMVTTWNGQWDDTRCEDKIPFMCYKGQCITYTSMVTVRQHIVKLTVTSRGNLNDPAVKTAIMSQMVPYGTMSSYDAI
ncbi:hypothetical protein NFI96_018741 [Prochilodus magdalenae]|nr:hypothetical protein NFI96_018741 [Prochilodus magdalenae]